MQCMYCYTGTMQPPRDNHPSYIECSNCGAIELTYLPMDYQEKMHTVPIQLNEDGTPHPQIIFVAGGYGSGKSRSSLQEFFLRCMENDHGTGAILAPTLGQLKRTTIKTLLDEVIPPPLIERYNKADGEIRLINGFTIYTLAADEEEKIRSLNLGIVHVEEISGIDKSIYVQLLTRLRDRFTKVKTLFACTNPSGNWVRDTFALNEDRKNPNHPEHDQYNPYISVHIWPTKLNKHLPRNFIELASAGRPDWWRRKFLEGSFEFNDGAVYPNYGNCIIEPFDVDEEKTDKYGIPKEWERFVGLDWGMRNPTAAVFGAIDPKKGEVIIYNEYYVPNRLLPEHAKHLKPLIDEIPAGLLRFMVADPSIRNKNADVVNGKSVQALFQEYGMFFQPGNNAIEMGVLKVNSYIERGKLKVYKTCMNLNREMLNYQFPELDIDDSSNLDEKPEKKADHGPDSLRYALVKLPDEPDMLKTDSFKPPRNYRDIARSDYSFNYDEEDSVEGGWLSYV